MKKVLLLTAVALTLSGQAYAQRVMDELDRGVVAVSANNGMFVSWRVLGEDADNVKFNLYRDGSLLNSQPLSVSNFTDASGTASSKYVVKTVVDGVEKETSKASINSSTDYIEIKVADVPSNIDGSNISANYEPNDATVADLDGDGQMEILIKLTNTVDHAACANISTAVQSKDFDIIQVYKLDGTLMWWIDMGPNMADFQTNEINIAAYDWDLDGKAECILRAGDGTVVHHADGTTTVVGDPTQNTRNRLGYGGGGWFTVYGNEYLLYLNGETGKPYQVMTYPLPRLEQGEHDIDGAWGDGYGHRSNKHFFGAPYFDGRKPSVFISRGIYTRHKMIAYDVDPVTHELVERWRWNINKPGSPWYGQGYHNYVVADVDWDGRDEIVYGSMVIDDNGKGLSTTGLGHGDSQHVGDFNPYIYGHEFVGCNEDQPGNNYRDATTSQIYYRNTSSDDDGRCIAGNFTNKYPGSQFTSARDYTNLISTVSNAPLMGTGSNGVAQNFRIFWDGDLLDETFNYANGRNTAGTIYKYGKGAIKTFDGTATNNDTKGTPCFQGDILGDWREEVIMRTADNKAFRIYTTTEPTQYRIYTLLHDPQYRNAMVWQMNGYNQTPRVSYFVGELEGITQAPPAPTMTGREEVNGSVSAALNGKDVVFATTGNASASVADGASPALFVDNAPSWVQGHDDNNNITYEYYTHTLTGGAFAGSMKLVKLGAGTLVLPAVAQKYTGDTEVWLGTLAFDGELSSSHLVLNRHSALRSDGGQFKNGIDMYYGAELCIGSDSKAGTVTTTALNMGFGSKLCLDLFADGSADNVVATSLKIEKKDWEVCPKYNAPVISFTRHFAAGETKLPAGTYKLGSFGTVEGNLNDVILEGLDGQKAKLSLNDGELVLEVSDTREAAEVVWTGANGSSWDLGETSNFKLASGEATEFVSGDRVVFDDSAVSTDVNIPAGLYPSQIVFNNSEKQFTISGAGFEGQLNIEKNGTGRVVLKNTSTFTGNITINGGTVEVAQLGASEGAATGALGQYQNPIVLNGGGMLAVSATGKISHPVTANEGGIEVMDGTLTMVDAGVTGKGTFIKAGKGQLNFKSACDIQTMRIDGGKVFDEGDTHAVGRHIVFNGTNVELEHNNSIYSYSSNSASYEVPEGKSGKLQLDGRCDYSGKLTGKGKLEVVNRWIRCNLNGDWSEFEGTMVATSVSTSSYGVDYNYKNSKGLPNATLQVSSGCTFLNGNLKLGALTGSGTIGGSGTTTVGSKNENCSFSGSFADNINLTKVGTGKLTLSNTQTGLGVVNVNEGELAVKSAKTDAMLGAKALTVDGVLSGSAVMGNSSATFRAGSVLNPGSSARGDKTARRTIRFTNGLTMEAGSTVLLEILAKDKYSQLAVDGKLTLGGQVNVALLSGYKPAVGDEIVLWTAGSADDFDFKQIVLPELPAGLYWDTTGATATNGLVKVTDQDGLNNFSGIRDIAADAVVACRVMTVSGIVVKEFTATAAEAKAACNELAPGVYIVVMSTEGVNEVYKIAIN